MKKLFTMKNLLVASVLIIGITSCRNNQTSPAAQTRVLSATEAAAFDAFKQLEEDKAKKRSTPVRTVVVYKEPKSSMAAENTAPVAKKGWSKAAKGAVIGGSTGAVAGAIINKRNRPIGAAIGAAVGAGVGYVIGKAKDKKDGRG